MKEVKSEREYVVVDHGNTINMYAKDVWDTKEFRRLIGGEQIGQGLTFDEAVAMRRLMESAK